MLWLGEGVSMHCLLFLAVGMICLVNCLMAGSDVRNVNVKLWIRRVCIVKVFMIPNYISCVVYIRT